MIKLIIKYREKIDNEKLFQNTTTTKQVLCALSTFPFRWSTDCHGKCSYQEKHPDKVQLCKGMHLKKRSIMTSFELILNINL